MNIAFIPARCGSKSIKFKNIKLFCNKPLIYWNIKELDISPSIDEIIVATDCDKIEKVVKSFKISKVKIYRREKKNANDKSSSESVMIEYLNKSNYHKNDIFILVQATSPLTESEDFENALNHYIDQGSDSLLTCVRKKQFIWSDYKKPINYDYNKRPRRQDFKGVLVENGAFYINSIGKIMKSNNRLYGKISIYEMDEQKAIEIDEKNDWFIAEKLMYDRIFKNTKVKTKIFLSDVDGTLTDSGMYYSENGNELKKFNTRDGKGFEILKNNGIKTGIITSEKTKIVENRAKKLKLDYIYQGVENKSKLEAVLKICKKEKISISEVAYIGDDINCIELLKNVGIAACPNDAITEVKKIKNINIMKSNGGYGAVREFISKILDII